MQTVKTTGTAVRNEMLHALVAAPKDIHRNEPSSDAPQVSSVAFVSAATLAAATAGLVATWATRGPRSALVASAGTLALAGLARWQLARWFAERVPYVMERRVGALEIRRFERQLCAETGVEAQSFDEAANAAFPRLAKYIFGNRIAMTTPVVIARADRPDSESLPEHRVSEPSARAGRFTMRFFLPAHRALSDLPTPSDDRVHVRELAAHRSVALAFGGRATGENVVQAEKRLLSSTRHALLTIRGEPMFAGFDGPTTLPFLRHNEVWVNLA